MIVDGEAELLRVADPTGRFQVVQALAVPGIFSVHLLACGGDDPLPCLGI